MAATEMFLIAMALLAMGDSVPAPEPDPHSIDIQISQEVNSAGCCNGVCPCKDKENILTSSNGDSCTSGTIINSCLMIECINGKLVYQRKIFPKCGTCYAHGEPHFTAFHDHLNGRTYNYQGTGTHVMTQQGLKAPAFGVTAMFKECEGNHSCVESATYREPGLTIKLVVPVEHCSGAKGATSCKVEVFVAEPSIESGRLVPKIIQTKVEERIITDTGKAYYIFDDTLGIPDQFDINVNCMNIVGSTGISVSLCSVKGDYALLYIWLLPIPSLMNQVYGLCDRYPVTGTELDSWLASTGIPIPFPDEEHEPEQRKAAIKTFAKTWRLFTEDIYTYTLVGNRSISEAVEIISISEDHKCTDVTVKSAIEQECNDITAEACGVIPGWECSAFTDSCVFDLCRFSNHTSYAQGYDAHMLIHIQLATPDNTCPMPGVIYE